MKKRILFVCIENSARSQMAEGFAKNMAGDKFDILSAGSKPSYQVNPAAKEVMKEIKIDISEQSSKGFFDLPYNKFDYVISMGCLQAGQAGKDVCPYVPANDKIEWDIEDPKGKDIEFFRKVRDKIKAKIEDLLDSISNAH